MPGDDGRPTSADAGVTRSLEAFYASRGHRAGADLGQPLHSLFYPEPEQREAEVIAVHGGDGTFDIRLKEERGPPRFAACSRDSVLRRGRQTADGGGLPVVRGARRDELHVGLDFAADQTIRIGDAVDYNLVDALCSSDLPELRAFPDGAVEAGRPARSLGGARPAAPRAPRS